MLRRSLTRPDFLRRRKVEYAVNLRSTDKALFLRVAVGYVLDYLFESGATNPDSYEIYQPDHQTIKGQKIEIRK